MKNKRRYLSRCILLIIISIFCNAWHSIANASKHGSNVLFIPGAMGSRLYEKNGISEDKLWVANLAEDIRELYLNDQGQSLTSNVYTKDVVDETFGFSTYGLFVSSMDKLVSDNLINEWKAFPYDWRFGLAEIVAPRPSLPTVDLSSNQILISRGGTVNLSWSSTSADTCTASGAWSGEKGISGNEVSVRLFSQSIFVLTCRNSEGSATDSVTVNIRPPIFGEAAKVFTFSESGSSSSYFSAGARLQDRIAYLDEEVMRLASSSKTGKVTIIAHSYGGLVAKELMMLLEARGLDHLVDRIILVAVPQLGTPQALLTLLHGNAIFSKIFSREVMREFAENLPSAYELIPSIGYFDKVADPVITFDARVRENFPSLGLYGMGITNFTDLNLFLRGENGIRSEPESSFLFHPNVLDEELINSATTSHARHENWLPKNGAEIVQVAGWGLKTTKGIKYEKFLGTLDYHATYTIDGDETVVVPSASHFATTTHYLNLHAHNKSGSPSSRQNYKHSSILETKDLQNLIKGFLIGSTTLSANLKTTPPTEADKKGLKYTSIGLHSPVAINIFDEFGNHTGISTTTEPGSDLQFIDEEIPNSSYEEIGEGKYVHISTEDDHTILLTGTGTGTFTLDVTKTEGDEVVETYTFTDVSVGTTTRGFLTFRENGIPQIELINDGMSRFYNPDVLIDPDEIKVPNGLVGYWRFNEGDGTTTEDNSGNVNIGILTPNITWITGTSSATSTHLKFGSAQDFVSAQDSNSLDMNGSFTAVMWIKPTSTNDQLQTLLVKGPFNPGGRNYSLATNYGWSMKGLWAEIADCNFYPIAELTQPIQLNKWQHLALRYDHASKKREIFLNGILVHSSTASVCTPLTNTQPLYIGGVPSSPWSGFSKFTGSIDEVRLYNRAIAESEIKFVKD